MIFAMGQDVSLSHRQPNGGEWRYLPRNCTCTTIVCAGRSTSSIDGLVQVY